MMWMPKTEEEIIEAVTSGALEESTIFDAKRELPDKNKNKEIAKDVAAMAVNGGVIIYGIDEDEQGRPNILSPVPLAGQRERIASVVQSSVQEPPVFSSYAIPTAADPAIGYIVVVVPPSERAPHMVVVKGEYRYYGRSETVNVPLSEGEVARIYERRQRSEVDREALLNAEIERAPIEPHKDFVYLHMFARPVFRNEDMLSQALGEEAHSPNAREQLRKIIGEVSTQSVYPRNHSPDFDSLIRYRLMSDGWMINEGQSEPIDIGHMLRLKTDFDGSTHLFCGRAGERINNRVEVFDGCVAGNGLRFLVFIGKLYEKAKYFGMVDLGVALTGVKGATLYTQNIRYRDYFGSYEENQYRKTLRTSAITLVDEPRQVARQLFMPFFNMMSQGIIKPFDLEKP